MLSSRLCAMHAVDTPFPLRLTEPEPITDRCLEYLDEQGQIGLISSITAPCCGGCVRARVTAGGVFYARSSSDHGSDLMPLLRHAADRSALRSRILSVWSGRDDRYSEERGEPGRKRLQVEMYRKGG